MGVAQGIQVQADLSEHRRRILPRSRYSLGYYSPDWADSRVFNRLHSYLCVAGECADLTTVRRGVTRAGSIR